MKRVLFPILILTLALLLQACGGKNTQWGNLQVSLDDAKQTEKQWSANLAVKNATQKVQSFQYQGASKYVLVVKQGDTEVLRQGFDARDPQKPETINLDNGVVKKSPVVWTYLDQNGNRVAPGKYQITVQFNAATAPRAGEDPKAVQGKLLGPITVTVK